MRKSVISALALSIGIAGSAMAQDCTSPAGLKTIAAGKLTIAVYDYPPLNIVNADGTTTGIDPQIAKAIAAANCLEVVEQVIDAAATIQSVVAGKADMAIGGWNRTAKRAEVLGISNPTYLDPIGILSKDGVTDVGALEGKTIGTITGFQWIDDLQALYGDNVKLYPSAVSLAQDLAIGRIDVAFDAYNSAIYAQSATGAYPGITIALPTLDERVKATVEPAQSSFLFTKGNDGLETLLNDGLANLHADGTIKKLMVEYGFDERVADVGAPRLN